MFADVEDVDVCAVSLYCYVSSYCCVFVFHWFGFGDVVLGAFSLGFHLVLLLLA